MENVAKKLDNFSNKKVVVLGDIMLDKYIIGNVRRISPEAPVPVLEVTDETYSLGGAANVANNIISLGARASLFGVIGLDYYGDKLSDLVKSNHIRFFPYYDGRQTTVKVRMIAGIQQLLRCDYEVKNKINEKTRFYILKDICDEIDNADALILSDYDKGVLENHLCHVLINNANVRKKLVVASPKPSNINNFHNSNVISQNHHEVEIISGIAYGGLEGLIKIGTKISNTYNIDNIIITCGKEGAFFYNKDGYKVVPTFAKEVYDVTGAGDTFLAALTLSLVSNFNLEEALTIANHAAGIKVSKVGVAAINLDELKECFKWMQYLNQGKLMI